MNRRKIMFFMLVVVVVLVIAVAAVSMRNNKYGVTIQIVSSPIQLTNGEFEFSMQISNCCPYAIMCQSLGLEKNPVEVFPPDNPSKAIFGWYEIKPGSMLTEKGRSYFLKGDKDRALILYFRERNPLDAQLSKLKERMTLMETVFPSSTASMATSAWFAIPFVPKR